MCRLRLYQIEAPSVEAAVTWYKSIERAGTSSELHLDLNRYVDKSIFHKSSEESLFACFNTMLEECEEQLKEIEREEAELLQIEQKKETIIYEKMKEAIQQRFQKVQKDNAPDLEKRCQVRVGSID